MQYAKKCIIHVERMLIRVDWIWNTNFSTEERKVWFHGWWLPVSTLAL